MEAQFWSQLEGILKERVGAASYNRWLAQIEPKKISAEKAILTCPNSFVLDWVKLHYYQSIVNAMKDLAGKELTVELAVAETSQNGNGNNVARVPAHVQRPLPGTENYLQSLPYINQGYTFDNFVVGPSNHLAYASSLAIANSKNRQYNPFFLHSSEGLGKTHLSSAIGSRILSTTSNLKLFYTTAEWFTHEMIQALRKNYILEFKEKYRKHCDVLFIEDIQFLQKKEKTQEEIFYTLNTLIQMGKQVVLTANSNPREIKDLKSNLKSQMGSGLVIDIKQPDYETRRKIIIKKCAEEGVEIPQDVVDYIARSITRNIRDLNSAIIHVIATSSLLGENITMELAKESLKSFVQKVRVVTVDDINRFVAKHFKVTPEQMRSKSRNRAVTYPRQVSYFFCRKYTNSTLAEIGASLNRNHSSVVRALSNFESSLRINRSVRDAVAYLTQLFEKECL